MFVRKGLSNLLDKKFCSVPVSRNQLNLFNMISYLGT